MPEKKTTAKKSTAKKSDTSKETSFKKGDRVTWSSSGGNSTGKIVKKVTSDGKIKDFEYKASKDDPKYIVENDQGEQAAHKAESLKKA
jgi:N-methylhydantoinase B/oxoprolinase/acetone carboxylase alpha subunit